MKYSPILLIVVFLFSYLACSDKNDPKPKDPVVVDDDDTPFDISTITDTYPHLAPIENYRKWGPYNTHDPSVLKSGDYYYSYSTDAAYGTQVWPGIQIRRSKDLIKWEFSGWAFKALPAQGSLFIRQKGGEPFNSLWAPYIMKVNSEYRLYYSLSSPVHRLSVIGLAVANHPLGPWTERGLVVTSTNDWAIKQTNAIDPTVVIDPLSGKHWMYYGSAYDGIYVMEINPSTGLASASGDKGVRIAQRGFTGTVVNGNIEAPEVIYHPDFKKYYLFLAYDWLETKYNIRVGRADSPLGPFLDFNGNDMNIEQDNWPMIVAPYKFNGHNGWQGVSHCAVFWANGKVFMAHQGRPVVDKYYMVMHVRELFWTQSGWPVASPQRYAGVDQTEILKDEMDGEWQHITFEYKVVPGYANEQLSADVQSGNVITLNTDGSINGNIANKWEFLYPNLKLTWENGTIENLLVFRGRNWEANVEKCLLFSGFDETGKSYWGKK